MPRLAQLLMVGLCLAIAAPALAQSQATTGTIEGIVSDTTGAVVPGATVTFTNIGTGFTREVVTDADGRYRGLALPLGTYTIAVRPDRLRQGAAGERAARRRADAPDRLHARRGRRGPGGQRPGRLAGRRNDAVGAVVAHRREVGRGAADQRPQLHRLREARAHGRHRAGAGRRGDQHQRAARHLQQRHDRRRRREQPVLRRAARRAAAEIHHQPRGREGVPGRVRRRVGGVRPVGRRVREHGHQERLEPPPRHRVLLRPLRRAALRELGRHQRRRFQPAPVRRLARRPDQAGPDVLLRVVRPERGAAAEVEGGVRGPGDQPQQRGDAAAQHSRDAVRPDSRRGRGEPDAADQRRARAARQGGREHHDPAPGERALRVLLVAADQRDVRRADLDQHRERHRAGPQPLDRGAGEQHARTIHAERIARSVRSGAAAASVYRSGSPRHRDRQLPRRRGSIVPLRPAVLPAGGSGDRQPVPGCGRCLARPRAAPVQVRRRSELDVDDPGVPGVRARALHLHRRHGPVRGVPEQPDVRGRAVVVRPLPAEGAARRPLDRRLGPAGHPGLGTGVLLPGQVEPAAERDAQPRPALGGLQLARHADAARRDAIRAIFQRSAVSRPTPARSPTTGPAGSRASA